MEKIMGEWLLTGSNSSMVMKRVLEQANITDTIIVGQNGLDGMRKISEFIPMENICPEFIFVDIEMPIMAGIEFIENFYKMDFLNKNKVNIIANSVTINSHYHFKFSRLGINDYYCKSDVKKILNNILFNEST